MRLNEYYISPCIRPGEVKAGSSHRDLVILPQMPTSCMSWYVHGISLHGAPLPESEYSLLIECSQQLLPGGLSREGSSGFQPQPSYNWIKMAISLPSWISFKVGFNSEVRPRRQDRNLHQTASREQYFTPCWQCPWSWGEKGSDHRALIRTVLHLSGTDTFVSHACWMLIFYGYWGWVSRKVNGKSGSEVIKQKSKGVYVCFAHVHLLIKKTEFNTNLIVNN